MDEVVVQAFFEALRPAQLDALASILTEQQVERQRLDQHSFWFIVLTKPQWTPPPTQLQFSHSAHTEFVICDYAIEDAYKLVKRLLGLAYFWVGSENGVNLQLWATWLIYAVLVDLSDEVAGELGVPFADISLEMVYRSLYFCVNAIHLGEATNPVSHLVAHAKLFGLIKRKRKPPALSLLHLSILDSP